jgi:uncharacterized protein
VRAVLRTAGIVLLLFAVLVGLLWAFQRRLIYLPDSGPTATAGSVLPGAREVALETGDGLRLAAWYLPGSAPDAAGVLVANGNGGHRGLRAPLARALGDAGLVLRSPFVDLASVGAVHYPFLPVRAVLRDRYPVAEHVARVQVPTTVVYGSGDSIVPPDQSRAVADASAGLHRLVEVPGADHNDPVLLDGNAVVAAVVELAERA